MSSKSFFYQTKKNLIEHILVLEKRHNEIPIIFCFNGHFFEWGDIETLICFMDANAVIKQILLITNEGDYRLSSLEEYRETHGLEFQVLREFAIRTTDPQVEIDMALAHIEVRLCSYPNEDTKEKETKITEYLTTFLNKGGAYKGWFCLGNSFSLQKPHNSPDINKLYA
jgi:hypothetical protein